MGTAIRDRAAVAYLAVGFITTSQPIFLPGDTFSVAVLLVFALGSLWLVIAHGSRIIVPLPLALYLLWAGASVTWSGHTASSARAFFLFLIVTIIAAKCAMYQPVLIMRGLQFGATAILLLSVAIALIWPSQGLVTGEYNTGALQGVYSHRNTTAAVLVVGFAAAISRLVSRDGTPLRITFSMIFLGIGILATQSSTALAVAFAAIVVAFSLSLARRVGRAGRVLVVTVTGVLVVSMPMWFSSLYAEVVTALGRDVTLTGRTYIWEAAWAWVKERPVQGYGLGGVWREGHLVGDQVRRVFGFDAASSAHNGFLDVILHLGIIGLALYLCVLLTVTTRGLRLALEHPRHTWLIVIVAVLVLQNMVESRATGPNGAFLLALVAGAGLNAVKVTRRGELLEARSVSYKQAKKMNQVSRAGRKRSTPNTLLQSSHLT